MPSNDTVYEGARLRWSKSSGSVGTFTVRGMTAEGDRVAVEAECLGAHVSGKTYAQRYHFLFVIRDGKIHEMREYFDTMHANDVLCSAPAPGFNP